MELAVCVTAAESEDVMKQYYRNIYGSTASITINRDGTAKLVVKDGHGETVQNKAYQTERGAKAAMNRYGDCWRKVG